MKGDIENKVFGRKFSGKKIGSKDLKRILKKKLEEGDVKIKLDLIIHNQIILAKRLNKLLGE